MGKMQMKMGLFHFHFYFKNITHMWKIGFVDLHFQINIVILVTFGTQIRLLKGYVSHETVKL